MRMIPGKDRCVKIANRALLVIDVQHYFFSISSPAYLKGSGMVLPVIEQLVQSFKEHSSLVIGTIHTGGNTKMKEWWGHTVQEKWAIPMIKDIPIIRKTTYDAFVDTDLEAILQKNAIQQLFITGAMTHLCCETTARTGFVKGYDIVMLKDACVSKNKQYHEYSLHNLAHGVASVIESRDIQW
ncbi:cysteine hydrolase [bacterium]|nr:cysteine hydrolase [bacterium]